MLVIEEVHSKREKTEIMEECDSAFTISVIHRSNYNEIAEKIHKYAIFLKATTEEGFLVGYSAFYANNKDTGESFLTLFCIKQEMQHNHYGSALLNESLIYAKKQGMRFMKLEVLEADSGAICFYKRCGFDFTGKKNSKFLEMIRAID